MIFDIQRYSVHDGPGLRTNVFFKGCPLRCEWCAHPESQAPQPELMLAEDRCMTCGQFETPCPVCWKDGPSEGGWNHIQMIEFDERAAICPTGAIHWVGERRTAKSIMREVLRDKPFYDEGGGLTLTGGEPTMQPKLAEALLRLAKAEGISTAIETCGHIQWKVWGRLLPYLDHILFDLKHVDRDIHQAHTGLDNSLILDNLQRLVWMNIPVIVRVPLIPGFNASLESAHAIGLYVQTLNGAIQGVDVLPYHTLGKAKYAALGRDYPWADHPRLTEAEVTAWVEVLEFYDLPVKVGG